MRHLGARRQYGYDAPRFRKSALLFILEESVRATVFWRCVDACFEAARIKVTRVLSNGAF